MGQTTVWHGLTSDVKDSKVFNTSDWKLLSNSVLTPTKDSLETVAQVKLLLTGKDDWQSWQIVVRVNVSEGKIAEFWFPADYKLVNKGMHNLELDKTTLKFFLLYNSELPQDYGIAKVTENFIKANYDEEWGNKVLNYATKHPVKLFATAQPKKNEEPF